MTDWAIGKKTFLCSRCLTGNLGSSAYNQCHWCGFKAEPSTTHRTMIVRTVDSETSCIVFDTVDEDAQ